MKKHILLFVVAVFAATSFARAQDKIVKYCQVMVYPKGGFTNKRVAKISFGNESALFAIKDTSVTHQLKAVNSLTSEPDVLNFMSRQGWDLVNIHSASLYTTTETFYFKKTFDKTEFNE